MADLRDTALRKAAFARVRELSRRFDDVVPLGALADGFEFAGRKVSFGSFYSGIFRPAQMTGTAALCVVTAPPKATRPAPYEDEFDEVTGTFTYRFRDARTDSLAALAAAERDNRALLAAHELAVPLIYFRGIAPGQYTPVAPVFIIAVDRDARLVRMEAATAADAAEGREVSSAEVRRYATREAVHRLHQHRFRAAVLRAYNTRCAVCRLREASLLQAAHIVEDGDPRGIAAVVNGIALCAIHHLAYDRNLMGIDPGGVVHIAHRLLKEIDGPMLRSGLQDFHGEPIRQPRASPDRPDPELLAVRFERFERAA